MFRASYDENHLPAPGTDGMELHVSFEARTGDAVAICSHDIRCPPPPDVNVNDI